jgi:endoglycosylceramidase
LVGKDFEMMKSAGLNVIRLNVAWPGVEPVRGLYNDTYLRIMRNLSIEAASHGIYTIAEMHQDSLSERFCGEGIPAWASQPDPAAAAFPHPIPLPAFHPDPASPDGFPSRQDCGRLPWPLAGGAAAFVSAATRLYKNYDNLTNAWGAYWGKIAETWGTAAELLGFELLNEPNALDNEDLNKGDRDNLQPAYDVLAGYIRAAVPDGIILFAGQPGDRTGDPKTDSKPQGFTHAPGGSGAANQSVLAFHFYGGQNTNNATGYLGTRFKDARQLGVGVFMTESCCDDLLKRIVPVADEAGVSWAHWEWKDFCKETAASKASSSQFAAWGACKTGYGGGPFPSPQTGNKTVVNLVDLARTYATAIAGNFTTQTFDVSSGSYFLAFDIDPSIAAPTLVSASALIYTAGFNVTISPPNALTSHVVEGGVELHAGAPAKFGQSVAVNITSNAWFKCADEWAFDNYCACIGRARFGRGANWSVPVRVDGKIQCDTHHFEDPSPGVQKVCQCQGRAKETALTESAVDSRSSGVQLVV